MIGRSGTLKGLFPSRPEYNLLLGFVHVAVVAVVSLGLVAGDSVGDGGGCQEQERT